MPLFHDSIAYFISSVSRTSVDDKDSDYTYIGLNTKTICRNDRYVLCNVNMPGDRQIVNHNVKYINSKIINNAFYLNTNTRHRTKWLISGSIRNITREKPTKDA